MIIEIKCKDGATVHMGFKTDTVDSDDLKRIMENLDWLKKMGNAPY